MTPGLLFNAEITNMASEEVMEVFKVLSMSVYSHRGVGVDL